MSNTDNPVQSGRVNGHHVEKVDAIGARSEPTTPHRIAVRSRHLSPCPENGILALSLKRMGRKD